MSLDLDAIRARLERALDFITEAAPDGVCDTHKDRRAAYILTVNDVPALLARIERDRIELRDWGNDLLNVRGMLSPQGGPDRVPVPIVPTIAPAVEWLLAEIERLRGKCTCATGDYACMDGVVWGPCIHVGYCPDRDEDGDEAIAHCECKACHPDMAVTT